MQLQPEGVTPVQKPRHHHHAYLHNLLPQTTISPTSLSFFRLFFSDHILDGIVNNTNNYGQSRGAGDDTHRPWSPLTRSELLKFIALLLYYGIFPSARLNDYWAKDHRFPVHKISSLMTLMRFEQIKRFLHISDRTIPNVNYYDRVRPLMKPIQTISQRYYVSKISVSLDEMIDRFCGRSHHTYRLQGKPTPVRYKIYALCGSGYTYTFLPKSRIAEPSELANNTTATDKRISMTGQKVLFLVEQLPFQHHVFNVYMDNYFSTIPLKNLRNRHIGACGTCRTHSPSFPEELKGFKNARLDWDEKGAVIVNDVLMLL